MRGSRRGTMMLAALALAWPLHAQDASPAVAVLPFENTGSYGQDKENFDALEGGLPAILGSILAAHAGIRVVDRAGVREAMDRSQVGGGRRGPRT